MTPSAAFRKVNKLAAILFLVATAFSQAPPKYDPATESKSKGVVDQLKLVPPSGGKPEVYLLLKGAADTPQIYLCPKRFLDDMGVDFKSGDAIEIVGSKVKQDGAELTLAREITKGGDTLTLRFKDGKPAW